MKYIYLIFLFNLFSLGLNAQLNIESFILKNNKPILVYKDSIGKRILTTIMNDSIFENYYSVQIKDSYKKRYKVNIMQCTQYNSSIISGWVRKKECGIYVRNVLKGGKQFIKLYASPTSDSYEMIKSVLYTPVSILDISNDRIKISFKINKKKYIGWIDDYCGNVFNSCT